MNWELKNDRPVYAQLVEKILEQILDQTYPPESKLPSVRELASMASVNPNTMQKALMELEKSGLINSVRTTGKYVTHDLELIHQHQQQLGLDEIIRFVAKMESLGFSLEDIPKNLANHLKEVHHV